MGIEICSTDREDRSRIKPDLSGGEVQLDHRRRVVVSEKCIDDACSRAIHYTRRIDAKRTSAGPAEILDRGENARFFNNKTHT